MDKTVTKQKKTKHKPKSKKNLEFKFFNIRPFKKTPEATILVIKNSVEDIAKQYNIENFVIWENSISKIEKDIKEAWKYFLKYDDSYFYRWWLDELVSQLSIMLAVQVEDLANNRKSSKLANEAEQKFQRLFR